MTRFNRAARIALLAMVVALVAIAGPLAGSGAAVSAFSFTADDPNNAAETNHTVSIDSDAESGDVHEVHVRYTESDVSDVAKEDVSLTIGGASQTISSVNVSDANTLQVTLETAYTLDSTVSEVVEVSTANNSITNPQNAGDYTVEMAIVDGTGTDIASLSGTFSATQGPTPSINATNSDFSQGASIANYNGSENNSLTLQTEANSDEQELRLVDSSSGETLATFSNVTTVTSATDTSAGTYEFQLTQADMRSVPMAINENVSVDAEVHNTSASAPVNNFDYEIQNGDEVSQIAITHEAINDSNVGPDVEFNEAGAGLFSFSILDDSDDYVVDDDRQINGSDTTIYMTFVDADSATAFEEAGTFRTDAADVGDGEWMVGQSVRLGGHDVVVYRNEAGDLHPDGSSYATWDDDSDQVAIELGDRYDGETSADVEAENDPAPFRTRFSVNRLGNELSDLEEDNDGFLSMTAPLLVTGVAMKRRETAGTEA